MMALKRETAGIVVGAQPRVDLLPPEIKARKEGRRRQRSLVTLVIVIAVICAGSVAFATMLAAQSQSLLAQEQARTQQLLEDQRQYAEARTAANLLAAAKNARLVGSATEIFWREYLAEVQGTLPRGVSITRFGVDSISTLESAPVLSAPLQEARVATLSLTATSPGLPQIDRWLVNLRSLRGHADSTVSSITLTEDVYTATVTLNINTDAFERRFFEAEPAIEGEDKP